MVGHSWNDFFSEMTLKKYFGGSDKEIMGQSSHFFLSKCVPDGQLCYYVGPPSSTFVPQS